MELTVLVVSVVILYFILLFYHSQFRKDIYLNPADNKLNDFDYAKLPSTDNEENGGICKVIYPVSDEKSPCAPCGGIDYHRLRVSINDKHHVVDGVVLPPGTYCIRTDLPTCDQNKGFIVINGVNDFRCVCKFPHYFDGPSCSTRVACGGNSDIPLISSYDDREIDTDEAIDYYLEGAYCKCPAHDKYGLSYISPDAKKATQCLLDPCLYPVPFMDESLGLQSDGTCLCNELTPNRLDKYSPCSSCKTSPTSLPSDFNYNVKIPADCYNQFSNVVDLTTKYPCYMLRTPVTCGVMEAVFGISPREP